jgi:hypothetical protein
MINKGIAKKMTSQMTDGKDKIAPRESLRPGETFIAQNVPSDDAKILVNIAAECKI